MPSLVFIVCSNLQSLKNSFHFFALSVSLFEGKELEVSRWESTNGLVLCRLCSSARTFQRPSCASPVSVEHERANNNPPRTSRRISTTRWITKGASIYAVAMSVEMEHRTVKIRLKFTTRAISDHYFQSHTNHNGIQSSSHHRRNRQARRLSDHRPLESQRPFRNPRAYP